MYRIALIDMPFFNLAMPSLALMQLKSKVEERMRGRVSADIFYLNHEFGRYFGIEFYEYITNSIESLNTGLGDWLFRRLAFPDLPDNIEKYFARFFPSRSPEGLKLRERITQARSALNPLLDSLIAKYQLATADLVGFTSTFNQNAASFAMARKLKQLNPRMITVMGGANCEYPMGRVIAERIADIDFVFSGPALKSFPEFVQHCAEAGIPRCCSTKGVFSKDPKSERQWFGEHLDIDASPDLDYEPFLRTVETNFPGGAVEPILAFETSRGCSWGERVQCVFCGLNGTTLQYRSMAPGRALRQFESLFRHADRAHHLFAVDNIMPRNYLRQVLPMLEPPPGLTIFYEVRADLNECDVAVLAKAGVKYVQPGIESLTTSTLKLMRKGTTAFQNIGFLKSCAARGLCASWNLLVGFPGEHEDVYKRYMEIIPFLAHLPPPQGVFPVRFDRFSLYFNEAKAYGLDLHPLDYYSFVFPFEEQDLNDFAYYFSDRNLGAEYFAAVARWISKLQRTVDRWIQRWNGGEGAAPPHLCFKNGSTVIYDSRSGSVIGHDVGERGKVILNKLSLPMRIGKLAEICSGMGKSDITNDLASLERKGLIFREDDRVLSLLVDAPSQNRPAGETAESAPADHVLMESCQ